MFQFWVGVKRPRSAGWASKLVHRRDGLGGPSCGGGEPILRGKAFYCQNGAPDACRLGAAEPARLSAGWVVLLGGGLALEVRLPLDGKLAEVGGSAGTDQLAVAGAAGIGEEVDVAEAAGQARDGGGTVGEFAKTGAPGGDPLAEPPGIRAKGLALPDDLVRVFDTAESYSSLMV